MVEAVPRRWPPARSPLSHEIEEENAMHMHDFLGQVQHRVRMSSLDDAPLFESGSERKLSG